MSFLDKILKRFCPARPAPEARVRATLTPEELRVVFSDGTVEAMPREQIQEIAVRTTATGPFLEDVFWDVSDGTESLYIPQGSPDFKLLLEEFQRWPGFSSEPFIEAMCCTEDRRFVCWRKSTAQEG